MVAEIFCVDKSSIYIWIKKWKDEGTPSDKSKSGRPPSFTEDEKKCHGRRKFMNNHKFEDGKRLAMELSWFVRRLKPDVVRSVASLIPIEALLSFQV